MLVLDLRDLLHLLGDRLARARHVGGRFRDLAVEAVTRPLQLGAPRRRDQAFIDQRRDRRELLMDRRALVLEGNDLILVAGDLRVELLDFFLQDPALALERGLLARELTA